MQVVRYWNPDWKAAALGVLREEEVLALPAHFSGERATAVALFEAARENNCQPSELAAQLISKPAGRFPVKVMNRAPDATGTPYLLDAAGAQEIWGAGVTYERSREARMAESHAADAYSLVYEAERPELFFKATPSRCVGPNQAVAVRSDSNWTVPEPELALVLDAQGSILGYTLGNDMSARDIEGENPLYLPQAKVYRGCCSLGPVLLLAEEGVQPTFEITCSIRRDDREVFQSSISTARMRRSFPELASFLRSNNCLPSCTALFTGTGIVPPDNFSLQAGDVVEISAQGLGRLRNPVVRLTGDE